MAVARRHVPATLPQWGKVQIIDGGDLIYARDLVPLRERDRDASFVRYQLLVDKNARRRALTPEFEPCDFYGQLRNIFVLDLPPSRDLGLSESTTILLAAVHSVKIDKPADIDVPFYREEGRTEVVDLAAVQCVVGRVYDDVRKWWAIIDRSGPLAQPIFVEGGEDSLS
ncbi:hypothetical protein GLOTRDRAFT_67190 [Gloeophyllum trabeum ATCC 11539]|uniref:Uncharacterized protein n=1 Tax=Gloeophyllum trabeum (strain ATCC 11539 / FP-39264 / Madison 617) TaxID=670483 RepID=S7PQ38_GLOTA|nr:uncharacterized protein GLOTRDRAFT_67190 [Gloeophyllum trabeum ATCC 11539]EPQ49976.1 hypothetical protein GLOTRDRAFT_67190 [Gloeophyllum trabeum ATCC 11539]